MVGMREKERGKCSSLKNIRLKFHASTIVQTNSPKYRLCMCNIRIGKKKLHAHSFAGALIWVLSIGKNMNDINNMLSRVKISLTRINVP